MVAPVEEEATCWGETQEDPSAVGDEEGERASAVGDNSMMSPKSSIPVATARKTSPPTKPIPQALLRKQPVTPKEAPPTSQPKEKVTPWSGQSKIDLIKTAPIENAMPKAEPKMKAMGPPLPRAKATLMTRAAVNKAKGQVDVNLSEDDRSSAVGGSSRELKCTEKRGSSAIGGGNSSASPSAERKSKRRSRRWQSMKERKLVEQGGSS